MEKVGCHLSPAARRSLDLGMMDSGRAAIYWPSSSAWTFIATRAGDLYPSAHAGLVGVMYKTVCWMAVQWWKCAVYTVGLQTETIAL